MENWDVYLDDKKITTVETITISIAQPKMWGEYSFYRYVTDTVYASNFEQLAAGYQQQYNTTNSIAPGENITYTQAYYLGNEFSPVTVRATDYLAILQDYPAEVSKTLSLQGSVFGL